MFLIQLTSIVYVLNVLEQFGFASWGGLQGGKVRMA